MVLSKRAEVTVVDSQSASETHAQPYEPALDDIIGFASTSIYSGCVCLFVCRSACRDQAVFTRVAFLRRSSRREERRFHVGVREHRLEVTFTRRKKRGNGCT